jgi:branched-chain amino acid transport system ATP-binding protein
VSLHIMPGEVVGLMGHNGAGKSTLLKTIMGIIKPYTGTIKLFKQDISHNPIHKRVSAGLGFVPEDRRIFTHLTVLENLAIGKKLPHYEIDGRPPHVWSVEALFELFPNLASMPHRLGGQMSGGEQQMLAVARTLMGNPRVLLLDEPSEGVAPIIVEQMLIAVLALKKVGLCVLLSEQNAHFAQALCDRVYHIQDGHMTHPVE